MGHNDNDRLTDDYVSDLSTWAGDELMRRNTEHVRQCLASANVVTVTSKDIDNRMEDAAAFGLRWGAALAAKRAEVAMSIFEGME